MFQERLIFVSDLERLASRQLIFNNFPLACFSMIDDPPDFCLDIEIPVDRAIFFRWAITTIGPARLLVYSCFELSLSLCDPPPWIALEIQRYQSRLLTDGRANQ